MLHVADLDAWIELQPLLAHTLFQIVKQIPSDMLDEVDKVRTSKLLFLLNWGMDGAGNQSIYSHTSKSETGDLTAEVEGSIFATTLVPLRVEDQNSKIYWPSPGPQSDRFCRPVRLQFQKESKELIINEHQRMLAEIGKIQSFTINHNDTNILVDYQLFEAMLDGKCLNYVLGNNCTQRCPICGMMNTTFNDPNQTFPPLSQNALKHGIAPLHCCIRTMETLLNVSYRRNLKIHKIQNDLKPCIEVEKKKITTELHSRLGIVVEKVKQGFETTNTGNTVKRFFSHPNVVAQILQLPEELIMNFSVITRLLNLQIPLNWNYVVPLLNRTKMLWREHLPWFPMSPSIHKVLEHAPNIGVATQLSLGELGEDCGEATHKVIRRTRSENIRKMSKVKGIEDLMLHLLARSSPSISVIKLIRIIKRQSKAIPADLKGYVVYPITENTDSEEDHEQNEESSIESEGQDSNACEETANIAEDET